MKLKLLGLAAIIGLSLNANATPITVSGDYLSIQVDDNGTFANGSTGPGFAYDPTGSGSFTGTDRNDWFFPGAPFQGFAFKSAETGLNSNVNDQGISITGGAVVDVSASSAYDNAINWTGSTASYGISTDVFYNDLDKFIQLETVITAATNLSDARFGFFFDPDWFTETGCGDFRTTNEVVSSDLVTATGCDGTKIGLWSDSIVTHNVDVDEPAWSSDPDDYLDGTVGNKGLADSSIGIGFDIGELLAAQSITLTYSVGFANDGEDLEFTDTTSVPAPAPIALLGMGLFGLVFANRRKK